MCLFCLSKDFVVLLSTRHKFSHKMIQNFKISTGNTQLRLEHYWAVELVHLQDHAFGKPCYGEQLWFLSSFSLTDTYNNEWMKRPCWLYSNNFILLKISTSWENLDLVPLASVVSLVFDWLSNTEMPPDALCFPTLELTASF